LLRYSCWITKSKASASCPSCEFFNPSYKFIMYTPMQTNNQKQQGQHNKQQTKQRKTRQKKPNNKNTKH
jgi:hypothetical protein